MKYLSWKSALALLPLSLTFALANPGYAQVRTVFTESFNRASLNVGGPTTYGITVSGGDGGASIASSSYLSLTNNATAAANAAGRVYVTGSTSSYTTPYSSILTNNNRNVAWSLNIRPNAANLTGFGNGQYGLAVVLAASSSDLLSSTTFGYALVAGIDTSGGQPLHLIRFANGLSSSTGFTDLLKATSGNMSTNKYYSARVEYNPFTDNWKMQFRDDGNATWTNPRTTTNYAFATTTGTAAGATSVQDTTYVGNNLTSFGYFANFANASPTREFTFDNYTVALLPEPGTLSMVLVATFAIIICKMPARYRRMLKK